MELSILSHYSGREIVSADFDFSQPDFLNINNWSVKKIGKTFDISWDRSDVIQKSPLYADKNGNNIKAMKNDFIFTL